ncbi:tyrosine-type recombinase/integrase [Deinococcus yavapaiensis]|uniref:Site-specific recombinase XerD n=1 Tax=Deinococcus yavapaiensis KR-236 TaxID=694435 RepID=A0A318RZ31_9DEIO|nr:site-specific integrase [Deinococcus yavapaiensis]PYE48380.1 site-specific recombinase XerD [Deinococcus yavapaiensis KR-236]
MSGRGRRRASGQKQKRGHGEGTYKVLPDGRCRWQIGVTLPSGEFARKSGTAPSERLARAAVRKIVEAAEKGQAPTKTKLTVGEFVEAWIESRESLSGRTRDMYKDYLRLYIKPLIGSVKLAGVTPQRLRDFYRETQQRRTLDETDAKGKPKQLAGLGASARVHVHNILHGALAQAYSDGLISANPAAAPNVRPKAATVKERELKSFTPDEAQKFYEAARADRGGVLLAFMLATGVRRGEAIAIKWNVVNLEAGLLEDGTPYGTVDIRLTRSQSGSRVYEGPPKTPTARRQITVTGEALELLKFVKARTEKERAARLEHYEVTPYVFTTLRGTPYRPDNIGRMMNDVCRKAGVRTLNPHALRHTFVSVSGMNGASLEAISAHVGHASSFMTHQYRHSFPEERRRLTLSFSSSKPLGEESE